MDCYTCYGNGELECPHCHGKERKTEGCHHCEGEGSVGCHRCNSSGRLE